MYIYTIALDNHMYVYTHIHICIVVFCPDSNQEHVDHTGGENKSTNNFLCDNEKEKNTRERRVC